MNSSRAACVVLFSGGTDSTCAAALVTEQFERIHLLTFWERATANSSNPKENVERLRNKFGAEKYSHELISTDRLVQKISYDHYFKNFFRHGLFVLSTPGFSSLSWHMATIAYCHKHSIEHVFDGMTKELMHLPGHMPAFRTLIKDLYASYGIEFGSPVINWDIPPDQQFVDRLIVDRHGFSLKRLPGANERTTGKYLFDQGIFPHPNVKGSDFDHKMQHDCYPFVLFNVLVFWVFLFRHSEDEYAQRIESLFREKISLAKSWLDKTLADEQHGVAVTQGQAR